ncbi:MAG TPA: mercuric reductase [Stellaceae bacterium]|jgi:pyruvate/2-oxoglutarate dehydrogenase complex dihydrolipoamide dehydrogenase (E3) component|nr:mercuric reductase [Stellaceae bacterium]
MSQPERFEVLILGSGEAGKLLAWHMAGSGRRTAVVERRWVGGSCPNIACLPSKNEIWSARVAHLARHAAQFGTTIPGAATTDMAKVRQRKRDMVERETAFHSNMYKTTGTELIMGAGRFVAPKTLEVQLNDGGTRVLAGDRVFLNLGTHAAIPNVPGLEAARPLTHIEALELDYLPSHLVVLGGGYVGLEMAQAYRRFGSRVTIIEAGPQLMTREDPDVADEIQRLLGEEGAQTLLSAETLDVNGRSGGEVSLTVRTPSGEQKIEGSDILVAAGRVPNTAGIGIEEAGVELDGRGYIRVNERLETTAPDVWAMGECAGSPQFTHVSHDDFRIIRDNLAGGKRSTRDRLVPYCMFTDPPLAHVGLSESEAQRQGVAPRVARLPTSAVLRTEATDETQGFMKALVANDDRILGFTMIGAEAGEVMTVVHTAMLAELPYPRLRDAVIAHPTMAEGLGQLFSNVPAR